MNIIYETNKFLDFMYFNKKNQLMKKVNLSITVRNFPFSFFLSLSN